MTPHYADEWLTVYLGDCREALRAIEPDSVQTVITSPPYYGLRDYGTATWLGGDEGCDHKPAFRPRSERPNTSGSVIGSRGYAGQDPVYRDTCGKCGAMRQDGQIGLEATPAEYLEHMVEVFREVRRVLRPDGTVWLNLGDSYNGTGRRDPNIRDDGTISYRHGSAGMRVLGLKAKDRMMMPARVALALQADGWWLRDEIVWSKPNPMPSSVADRTTPAHEMVYLLTKRARYHYDADAIREPGVTTRPEILEFGPRPDVGYPGHAQPRKRVKVPGGWEVDPGSHAGPHRKGRTAATYRDKTAVDPNARGLRQAPEPGEPNAFHELGRNKRSVWTIATRPYPGAHFATFPERLVEPMILAGAPAGSVVLDPFGGSGTVAMVASRLGRRAIHIDLSPDYIDQAFARIARARAEGEGPAVDMPVPFADDGLWAEAVS